MIQTDVRLIDRQRLRGSRALVMGLGTHGGGVAAARFLAEHGAQVTVTDLASTAHLESSIRALADLDIHAYVFGCHRPADFRQADLLVVNPAVRPDHPLVRQAIAAGATVTSELELVLERCPCQVVGVTGSNGKSTTAHLLTSLLRASGKHVWLGGNCEVSLLPRLAEMRTSDLVVLELSSFQLQSLSSRARWPRMAVVTGCTPNHLDWHHNLAEYRAAKRRLVEHVTSEGMVVLPDRASSVATWAASAVAPVRWADRFLGSIPQLAPSLPGAHNRQNAALACTAALALGCQLESIVAALPLARGLPHRLERVAVHGGVDYRNDSAATTPESVQAAVQSCGRTWLLAGGRSKGGEIGSLAAEIAQTCEGVYCLGEVGSELAAAVRRAVMAQPARRRRCCQVAQGTRLEDGIGWAASRAVPGDSVLLSPGFSSRDQFRDYRERGEAFREAIRDLAPGDDFESSSCQTGPRLFRYCERS